MRLSRRAAGFLLAVAGWNVYQWATFIRNLARDHDRSTGFYVVHGVLIAINLAIAAALGRLGWRAWRAASPADGQPGAVAARLRAER